MNGNPKPISEMLRECCGDALERITIPEGVSVSENHLSVYSWPQEWPNSSCGFGGIACQAITVAQVFVIQAPTDDVLVYHKGRLARHLRKPTTAFWDQLNKGHMPGAKDSWEGMDEKE